MSTNPSPRPRPAKYSRDEIAEAICARIASALVDDLGSQFRESQGTQWFLIDDLLPKQMAIDIYSAFPRVSEMRERKTLREHKFVAAQMNLYDPQTEEALFAFHDPRVVHKIAEITGIPDLSADPMLYAGGISVMAKANFLNPHLDNSHNNDRTLYRALNLLYYVSPDWDEASGGHLELWPNGVKAQPLTIHSMFNRLIVMTTGPDAWHSVSPVLRSAARCCVSNYYFSPGPPGGMPYSRVTTFRGRPGQPARDLILRIDGALRKWIRKLRPEGIARTTHVYERSSRDVR